MARLFTFHMGHHSYVCKFRIGFTIFCLSLLMLCCALGIWQLHRYHYKKTLLLQIHERAAKAPQDFQAVAHARDSAFQSVKVTGHYRNDLIMLVQNRFYHDQPGYEVLTPLQIDGEKKLLLVDRGWVGHSSDPVIPAVKTEQIIKGYLKPANEYQFILGNNVLQSDKIPWLIQRINLDEISKAAHQDFYPFILRLSATEPYGYIRDWTIVTVTPERHMGYAIQWFALALILLIAYSCFCCERQLTEK